MGPARVLARDLTESMLPTSNESALVVRKSKERPSERLHTCPNMVKRVAWLKGGQ